ncbi:hypothetical protein RhiTH_010485 [Rhizoctonia solani]
MALADTPTRGSTNTSGLEATKSTAAPKSQPLRKKKVTKRATTASLDVLDETLQASPANAIIDAAPTKDTQASGKRKKMRSAVAQQVALQEAIENKKKLAKKKKQAKKAASTVIDKSPKATCAFLKRAKATMTNKQAGSATPCPPASAASTVTLSGVTVRNA